MIISELKFSNFRNFANETTLKFDTTDGKINIVYGLNGEGKTTLHQLFQWLFYGTVNFNKTPTGIILYNLHNASNLNEGDSMFLNACAKFSHLGSQYKVSRSLKFTKVHGEITSDKETLDLLIETNDHRWIPTGNNPQDILDEILPFVFSKYFFFDGERMVDDLKERKSISSNLQKAVYYLFNLQEYADAIEHIGNKRLTSTVLGKLDNDVSSTGTNIPYELTEKINRRIKLAEGREKSNENLEKVKARELELVELIKDLTEKIGASKGSKELEKQRQQIIETRDGYISDLKKMRQNFGKKIIEIFPTVMVSNKAISARDEVLKKIKENVKYVPGLNRTLLDYLLTSGTCICGTTITEEEHKQLNDLLDVLPPKSYQSLFHDYIRKCRDYADTYIQNENEPDSILDEYSDKVVQIDKCEENIKNIDNALKEFSEIDSLIDQRAKYEEEQKKISKEIDRINTDEIAKYDLILRSLDKSITEMREKQAGFAIINKKITLMEEVENYLSRELETMIKECRVNLQSNVEDLVDYILTSKKNIEVTDDFNLKVTNSMGDEYKNEGTFAVVSFSFILGLLKTLKRYDDTDKKKKYSLVLDAPFSKLDMFHKPRIINKLFEYGDQIILFSKDNISEYMDLEHTGKVYLLESSVSDQTITTIKEADDEAIDYYFSDAHAKEIEKRKHR